jgi:hypothetical protein
LFAKPAASIRQDPFDREPINRSIKLVPRELRQAEESELNR